MEDPRWLRLVTVGLVLAALAVGYFLLTGRFSSSNQAKPNKAVINQVNPTPIPVASETTMRGENTPNPTPLDAGLGAYPTASPSAAAPYPRGNVTTLPRTGDLQLILVIISTGIMVSGLSLRKFPH